MIRDASFYKGIADKKRDEDVFALQRIGNSTDRQLMEMAEGGLYRTWIKFHYNDDPLFTEVEFQNDYKRIMNAHGFKVLATEVTKEWVAFLVSIN